jgi:hypothetical protein
LPELTTTTFSTQSFISLEFVFYDPPRISLEFVFYELRNSSQQEKSVGFFQVFNDFPGAILGGNILLKYVVV